MCGIVGYLGERAPKEVLLHGLRKLEYRGYDSAGVAIFNDGKILRVRAQGKLSELQEKVKTLDFDGRAGIGHTRWATHGVPSERNAHPHFVSGISLVHNGIIENFSSLRMELEQQGVEFSSDTDSELIAHLIAGEIHRSQDLNEAVFKVLPRLEGAYSVLVLSDQQPQNIVAFKNGPPLIIGLGENEIFVASDIQALIPYTKKVIYLEDQDIAVLTSQKVKVYDCNNQSVSRSVETIEWSEAQSEKQGFKHFMLKEIYEQPRALTAAIDPHIDLNGPFVQLNDPLFKSPSYESFDAALKATQRVFIVACGTSFYAGMVGEYLIERIAGVPVEVDIASEFRYRHAVIPSNSMVVLISQSGETADTLAALRLAKQQGAHIIGICNARNSTMDREVHGRIYMNAGAEIGVASTKAFVSSLAVLNLLALALGKCHGHLAESEEKNYLSSLLAVPSQMESLLAYDSYFAEASSNLKYHKGFLYMARGVNFPIAMEGALKLKELAYMHAEGYAAGEMKHGPLALIDETMGIVMLAPKDELYEKTVSNLQEARARGGRVIAIGTGIDVHLEEMSDWYLSLPKTSWNITPILSVVPLQLLAYHMAEALGHDVDQPRNLAKSVTVE